MEPTSSKYGRRGEGRRRERWGGKRRGGRDIWAQGQERRVSGRGNCSVRLRGQGELRETQSNQSTEQAA